MSRLPLDEIREQIASEHQEPGKGRRLLLLALVAIAAGLVLGYLAFQTWFVPPVPQTIELARAEQDDYILMVAEAYAVDRDMVIAQQRLKRLNDPNTTERIAALAQTYAPAQDYVAQRLAVLAVAAGSTDKTLVALAATVNAPTPTPTRTPTRTDATALPRQPSRTPTRTLVPNFVVVTGVPTATPTIYYVVVTGEPTHTPTPRPPTPTRTPFVSNAVDRTDALQSMPAELIAQKIALNVPEYTGIPSAEIGLAARPKNCTPADQMPPVVTVTTLLCGGQTYAPFEIQANNITLYGDAEKTALVLGAPRRFAITAQGTNISIVGVRVEGATHVNDLEQWLCLYPRCHFTPEIGGAQGYGGGILLDNTSNAAVLDSQFSGGTTGIFAIRGFSNKIFNNTFADHNGWGVLLMQTRSEYIAGNSFARINRSCTGLDNVYHANGCESSALAMTNVQNTLVYNNTCRRVSNCYYANGDGGYGSANIKFYNNRCAGAKNNCFEVTFGVGHEFDYNTAVYDADFGDNCDYPFWIGGSTAYFGPHNDWNCLHDYDTALNDARTNANTVTEALALAPPPTRTPTPTVTRRVLGAQPPSAKPTRRAATASQP